MGDWDEYCYLIRDVVISQHITADDSGLGGLCYVSDSGGQDGVAVVGGVLRGDKPNEAL